MDTISALSNHERAVLDQTLLPELLYRPGASLSYLAEALYKEDLEDLSPKVSEWVEGHVRNETVVEFDRGFTLHKDQADIVYLSMSWGKSFGWDESSFAEAAAQPVKIPRRRGKWRKLLSLLSHRSGSHRMFSPGQSPG